MYEHMTYEVILDRMKGAVSDAYDKREGSIVHDALAPAAVELQLMYIEFDIILKETFGDTAGRDFLIKRARERGITPYSANYAVLKGEFTPDALDIPIGSRFSLDDLNYEVISKIEEGSYQLRCETVGAIGNEYFGNLVPIEYIEGLVTAQLTEILILGEDEEETEDLRKRYFDSFDTKPFGGNRKDYLEKTKSISGVGAVKVERAWKGGSTVKLTILDSEFNVATQTLIDTVQIEIDPYQDGEGLGLAPIGHIVTTDTAEEVAINIATKLTFEDGFSWDMVQAQVNSVIEDYLLELKEVWENQDTLTVRIAQIETRLLAIKGIVDIEGTSLNEAESNLTIGKYEIPILGGVVNVT